MSGFSGKCDLFDHIYGGCENWKEYFERFEEFKRKTGGKLYQERKVSVSNCNIDDICEMNHNLKSEEVEVIKTDKNGASRKFKEKHFTYWDKEYIGLKALNKKGVYVRIEIPFETVLDLIPYYPYVIACNYWSKDKEIVILARQSYPDSEIDDRLEGGYFLGQPSIEWLLHYKHELQEHYRDVLGQLFYDIGDRRVQISLKDAMLKKDDDHYIITVQEGKPIDPNFPVNWFFQGEMSAHWTAPKRVDDFTISMHERDVECYLKDAMQSNAVQLEYIKRRAWDE